LKSEAARFKNRKSAKAFGIELPTALLIRANGMIE
jgi:hypothetical protein